MMNKNNERIRQSRKWTLTQKQQLEATSIYSEKILKLHQRQLTGQALIQQNRFHKSTETAYAITNQSKSVYT